MTPVDCLAGTPCPSRGSLIRELQCFEGRLSGFERIALTCPQGAVVLMGDSFTEYVAGPYVDPSCVNIGCSGFSLRHLIQQLTRTPLLHSAGCVVLMGMICNSIGEEMSVPGRTEAQMLGNVDYMLEGLAGWFTGRGIWIAQTPVIDPYLPDVALTNARINACNGYLQNRFGSKSGWTVVNVNSTLAPQGQLLTQYSELKSNGQPQGCHLNRAAYDVIFNAVRTVISSY